MSSIGINTYLCFVLLLMQTMINAFCLETLLIPKNNISSRVRMLLWLLFGIVMQGMKCFRIFPLNILLYITPILIISGYVFILKFGYSGKMKNKLLHFSILTVQCILAELLSHIIFPESTAYISTAQFNQRIVVMVIITVTILTVIMNVEYTIIVLRVRKKKQVPLNPLWIGGMLLSIFAVMLFQSISHVEIQGKYLEMIFVYTVFVFAAMMAYLSLWEKRDTREEMKNLQQIMELEQLHYRQIEERREEMAKIRHDYNNIIASILVLIENKNSQEAENILKDLTERIKNTREYEFCSIPVVNAVLTEKKNLCDEKGIELKVSVNLGNLKAIKNIDLCMIFGNLLDNAIRSCEEVKAEEKKCHISIKGKIVREYIVIKCENSALPNPKKIIKGTGYGHRILSDISKTYNGDFQTGYENGIFTSLISLRNKSE